MASSREPGVEAQPLMSTHLVSRITTVIQSAYAMVLLSVFLVAFVAHGIRTASDRGTDDGDGDGDDGQYLTGPDGKPLPSTVKRPNTDEAKHHRNDFSASQRLLFRWLSVGVIVTFVGNGINVITHALMERPWWCGQATAVYIISAVFVYALILISLIDTSPSPSVVHLITWVVGILLELLLLAGSMVLLGRAEPTGRYWGLIGLSVDVFRVLILTVLVGTYALFRLTQARRRHEASAPADEADENSSLLQTSGGSAGAPDHGGANGNGNAAYGSTEQAVKPDRDEEAPPLWARPTKAPSKSWWEYLKSYSLLFPYLWPSKSRRLQLVVVVCFCLALLQRVVNVLVPYQVGVVTDILSGEDGARPHIPWVPILVFGLLKLLQGNGGVLGAVRSTLWIPIGQYSYQALSTSAFEHVHSLGLDFHLNKKTGEVLSALSKGSSINTFLEQVTFQVLPMVVDLGLAIAYFLVAFDAYYALVVAIVTFCYMYLTVRMAQWRAAIRREMVNAGRIEDAVKNDSMVSYETVKYFNAEEYEFERYRSSVRVFQKSEYQVMLSLSLMNVVQNVVFLLGLLTTSFIAAYQVTSGQRKVGQFVTLLTYMTQLQSPLNFFGTFYRSIQSAMINSERMLELFKEQPTVVDDAGVVPLASCDGRIEFDEVKFAYDSRKPALDGLSYVAAPGTTTALVGESGGGKSTVFRLLFRFYGAAGGRILVDGKDVRDISIESLRRHIGIVPQDTVLFNETLMYNLKYANPDATDEMVYDACRAASIHDRILSFPDAYLTMVGERGLRLSGGEKQRVAIARTILKDPRIILLDEATAALDSETEQHIQMAFETLSRGRTMLVIAHRLSTITNADQILCLHAGRLVEAGTHSELLALDGRYANMWNKQIRAEKLLQESTQTVVEHTGGGIGSDEDVFGLGSDDGRGPEHGDDDGLGDWHERRDEHGAADSASSLPADSDGANLGGRKIATSADTSSAAGSTPYGDDASTDENYAH